MGGRGLRAGGSPTGLPPTVRLFLSFVYTAIMNDRSGAGLGILPSLHLRPSVWNLLLPKKGYTILQ